MRERARDWPIYDSVIDFSSWRTSFFKPIIENAVQTKCKIFFLLWNCIIISVANFRWVLRSAINLNHWETLKAPQSPCHVVPLKCPFTSKMSLVILLYSVIQFLLCKFEEFDIGSTDNPLIDIFLYSRHLSARYCINIVKIKSSRRIGRRSGSNK